ncbi:MULTISPECIES: metallophosphoesterase [unclassified Haladaptatus]|uniref:metallophosphoesterase n=1 Tax=unclassified Haladaptatus TaxID=2622732 RepID=UPI00209C4436|nr:MULTISPECIES: metallophosphoesterase [unclassified Haladaptatus]MCO8242861.1 metallophosphoesterase [Haladaptatus sp. AB643]MCO8252621.1 metallophosphoesterase [Haladaptatus sp. AB618]
MIAIVSDTHSRTGHELAGRTLEAVRRADLVVHAGDFTTTAVLDAFEAESSRLVAVRGNNATAGVADRLPAVRTFEENGVRFALTHRRRGGSTGLSLFGQERDADVVVSGHTHRHLVEQAGEMLLLNPGSYAQPRGNRPTHIELEPEGKGFAGRVYEMSGELVTEFPV